MSKIIASAALVLLLFVISYVNLAIGWGLTVHNWHVYILTWVATWVVSIGFHLIRQEE